MIAPNRTEFTNEELRQRAFLRVANVMFGMWEERGSSDTRLLEAMLIPNEFVMVGESLQGTEHREHVIPRLVICIKCHEMFEEGVPIEIVANFIREHLKIVLISKEEKKKLDNKNQLNLKQRMPDGWSFEDGNIYARLDKANIRFKRLDNR